MSTENINLPHETNTSVNVYTNETPDTATLNRMSNRLLQNDIELKTVLEAVLCTEIGDGLLGTIGDMLSIDESYINTLLEGIVDGEVSPYSLASLTDVLLENLQNGHMLIYDADANVWTNGLNDSSVVQATFTQESEYVKGISHATVSTAPIFTNSSSSASYSYVYDTASFSSTEATIDPETIRGFTVSAQLFGRIDVNTYDGVGGSDWTIKATYPDGESYNILKYHSENIDDDGGIGTTLFIPFNGRAQDTFTITVSLPNHAASVDSEGTTLNYFKIENIVVSTDGVGITPDVTMELINGTVEATDANVLSGGTITETATADGTHKVWLSRDGDLTTYNDWAPVFPISAPSRTAKTEIQFENYLVIDGSISTSDPGADSLGTGKAVGTIFIDWITTKIVGSVTLYNGSSYDQIGSGFLVGNVGEPLSFATTSGVLGDKSITVGLDTSFRRIQGLPIAVDNDRPLALGKVTYTLRHYNVVGVDSLPSVLTFRGETTSNVIPHGLSRVPDTFDCVFVDGTEHRSMMSYTSLTLISVPNGTDGGLRYHGTGSKVDYISIKADDTNITISGNTPNGLTRIFTASIY